MAGDTNPVAGPSRTSTNAFNCRHCGLNFHTYDNLLRHWERIYASSVLAQANQSDAYMNNVGNSVQAENRKDQTNTNIHEKAKMYPINTAINRFKYQVLNKTQPDLEKREILEFSTNRELLQILSKEHSMQLYGDTASGNNPKITKGAPNFMTLNASPIHKDIERREKENILYQKNQQEKAEAQLIPTTFLLCKICQKFFIDKEEALAHNKNKHPNVGYCLLEAQVHKPLDNAQSQPHDVRDINNIERKNMRCLACHEVCALSETSNHQTTKHPELKHCLLFENYEAERLDSTGNQYTNSVKDKNQHANNQKYQDDAEFRTSATEPIEIDKLERDKIEPKTYEREKRKKGKRNYSEHSDKSDDSSEECSKAKIRKHRKYGEGDVHRPKKQDRYRSRSESLLLKYKNNGIGKIKRNKDYSIINRKKKEKNSRKVSDSENSSVSSYESSDEISEIKTIWKRKKNFVEGESNVNRKKDTYELKGDKIENVFRRRDDDTLEDSSDSNSQNDFNLKNIFSGFRKKSDVRKHLEMLLLHMKNKKVKKKAKTYKLYKCICDLHFLSEEKLYEHLKNGNHDIKSKSCKVCKRKFTKKILRTHIKIHHKNLKLKKKDFKIVTVESLHFSDTDSESDTNDVSPNSKQNGNMPSELLEKTNIFKSQDKLKQYEIESPTISDYAQNELESTKKDKLMVELYKCVVCDIHFLNELTFKQHLQKKIHDVKTKSQCKVCDLYFTKLSLNKHEEEHHRKLNYHLENFRITENTKFCRSEQEVMPEILLKRLPYPKQNGKIKKQVNLYKCDSCDIHFLHEKTWKQHLHYNLHCMTRTTKTQCPRCFLFFSKKSLTKHNERHHEKNNLFVNDFNILHSSDKLQQRSAETSSNDSLYISSSNGNSDSRIGKNTEKRLCKAKVYKCDLCDVLFLNEKSFKQHFRQNSEHFVQTKRKCKYCQFNFSSKTMNVHVMKHHKYEHLNEDDFEIIKSSELPKTYFERRENYSTPVNEPSKKNKESSNLRHLNMFQKDNTNLDHKSYSNILYKCEHCHLCFLTRKSLNNHFYMNDHDIKNIIKCDCCQYSFSNNSIHRHLEVHHETLKLQREDFDIVALVSRNEMIKSRSKSRTGAKKDIGHGFAVQKDKSINKQLLTSELNKTGSNTGKKSKKYLKLITNKLYKCSICNIYFVLKGTLIMHMNVGKHKQFKKMVTCRICQYTFSIITFSRHDMIQHKKLGLKREDLVIVDYSRRKKNDKAVTKNCAVQVTALQSSLITTTNKSYQQEIEGYLAHELLLTNDNTRQKRNSTINSVIVRTTKTPEASVDNALDTVNENFANTGVHFLQDMITKEYSHLPNVKNEPIDTERYSKVNKDIAKRSSKIKSEDTGEDKPIENEIETLRNSTRSPNCYLRRQSVQDFNTNVLSREDDYRVDTDECITVKVAYFPFVKKENTYKDSKAQYKDKIGDRTRKESNTNFIQVNDEIPETFSETLTTNALSDSVKETNEHNKPTTTGKKSKYNDISENKNDMLDSLTDLGGVKQARIRDDSKTFSSFCEGQNGLGSMSTGQGRQRLDTDYQKTVQSNDVTKDYGIQFRFNNPDANLSTALISTEIRQMEYKNDDGPEESCVTCESTSTIVCSDICREELSSVKECNHDSNFINLNTKIDGILKTTLDNIVLNSVANKKQNNKDKTPKDEQTKLIAKQVLTRTIITEQSKPGNGDIVSNTAVFSVENSKSLENIQNIMKPKTDGLFLFEDSHADVHTNNCGNVFGNIQVTDVKTTSDVFNKPVKEEIVAIDSGNGLILEIPDYLKDEVIEISSDEE